MNSAETTRTVVWIVDDSRQQAELARRALTARHDVEVFLDGPTALERLAVSAPGVLILDWEMPDLSGLEICRFVRQTRDASELPIIILTASDDGTSLISAFEAGANDFVRKPCDPAELDARVAGLDATRSLYARLHAAELRLSEEALLRERFIAVLGHDLKQPLSAIGATAQTMVRHDEAVAVRAKRIVGAAQRMGRMIDDVLDLSRSRLGGGLGLRRVPASLAAIATRVIEEVRSSHPGRVVATDFADDGESEWDVDRIAQVCSNLIGNALKHGDRDGEIKVVIRRDHESLVLSVENQGVPIEEGARASLFDAFRQGNRAARSGQGLGLGLFIVDQIVANHGGRLTVTSDAEATIFTASWPLGTLRKSNSPAAPKNSS